MYFTILCLLASPKCALGKACTTIQHGVQYFHPERLRVNGRKPSDTASPKPTIFVLVFPSTSMKKHHARFHVKINTLVLVQLGFFCNDYGISIPRHCVCGQTLSCSQRSAIIQRIHTQLPSDELPHTSLKSSSVSVAVSFIQAVSDVRRSSPSAPILCDA